LGPASEVRISKRTQIRFGEFASGFATLAMISQVFESEGFEPDLEFESARAGQRRTLVAQYHATVDPANADQQQRLLNVYLDALESWCERDPEGGLPKDAADVVLSLRRDGAPLNEDGRLVTSQSPSFELARFSDLADMNVLREHERRMEAGVAEDPAAAIGSAKELAESVCKLVLDDYGIPYAKSADILDLYKAAADALAISRTSVPASAKGSQAAQRVLQNLATMVQSLAELRNELGVGHGRTKVSPALARHARLACNASTTLTVFVLDTWQTRKAQVP
jgi:predicted RNA-binding Zn ribbon-like protein